jgi:hypothetical protein
VNGRLKEPLEDEKMEDVENAPRREKESVIKIDDRLETDFSSTLFESCTEIVLQHFIGSLDVQALP